VCFQSSVTAFAELAHKCRHRELHTNESEMDLNYQQLRLQLSHFLCAGWTELTCEIFCPNCFLHFGYQKCFCFPYCCIEWRLQSHTQVAWI